MSAVRCLAFLLVSSVACSSEEQPALPYYAPAGDPTIFHKGDDDSAGDTHVNPGDTHVNPGDTHVNPGDTHVNPGDTHVNPGDTQVNPGDTHVSTGEHITQSNLQRITGYLASDTLQGRENGSAGGAAARQFLIDELIACNIPSLQNGTYEQPITTGNGTNILAKVTGTNANFATRHVILSAHYDHLGSCDGAICNGAYDNATAVAAVLALACELQEDPPARSVIVAFWDSEEPPDFLNVSMGSEYYAAHPIVPLAQTDVAIVLDLMGGNLWGNYQGTVVLGGETSQQLYTLVTGLDAPAGLDVYHGGLHLVENMIFLFWEQVNPWSDYDGFRDRQVPVLFMSDGQNRYYHTPEDEVGIVDFPKLLKEAQYLRTMTTTVANSDVTPTFIDGAAYYRDSYATWAILEDALAPGGLVDSFNLSVATENILINDRNTAAEIFDRLNDGGSATGDDVWALRSAVQRVMCHAGGHYDTETCNSL